MSSTFGSLLKHLRKRVGMTQDDLAAAIGYSRPLIGALERNDRLPDLEVVIQTYLPALGLQDEPQLAAHLVELAAMARGERPPLSLTLKCERRLVVTREEEEAAQRLPAPPTALLGRDQEINHLCNRLMGHHGRLLTLVGPPGVGKTRLAHAVGADLQRFYQDGACFVALAAVHDPALVASTLVTALKLQDGSSKPPKTRVIEHLRRKELLLILDNFEQLLSPPLSGEGQGVRLVAELLAECAGLRVLVTSRERLHLRAEQRYRVLPLTLAAAVDLFAQCAAAVDPDFVLTAANRPLVEAICQRLDRLPLALELCAGQVDLLSLSQLLAGLQSHRLDLLVAGAHDLPPQQRTLRIAIGRSYALLNDEERALFRSLGVFMGGFELRAVAMMANGRLEMGDWRLNDEAIAPSLVSTLRSLVSKSLVHTEPLPSGEHRFQLLETLREFALEQLHAQDEEAEIRQRHYDTYLHLFRAGDGHLRGPEATVWLARLQPEQDNLRAALQWALDAARYVDMAWLLIVANFFWYLNGHRYETAIWIARLLPHRQALAVDQRLAILTHFVSSSGEREEFRAEIIDLMERCPSKQLQSVAWHFISQSNASMTLAYTLARAASEAPELGPEFGAMADHEFILAANQLSYTDILLHQGEIAQATRLVKDSLERFRRRGNKAWIGDCLGTLGNLALLRGDIAEAHTHLQEVVTVASTHNLLMALAEWQPLFGLVTLYGGNAAEARRLLEEGLRFCLEVRNTSYLARACTCLAELALWEGDTDEAMHWLGQSLAYHAKSQRITIDELQRLFVAARLTTMQGQYERAATLLGLATAVHRQIHHIYAGPMLPLVDAALATVREALDPTLFTEVFARGQQLSLEEAFATILASSHVASAPTNRQTI